MGTMTKKTKPQKPDEIFSRGPFTVARFGRIVSFREEWQEGEFDKFQNHLIENYPNVVEEIDTLVSEIEEMIKVFPPEQLLRRAWWKMALLYRKIETEADIGEEEVLSVRMVDYVQSVIAAVPPAQTQNDDVTDEEWRTVTSKIKQLFTKINNDYQRCRIAKNRANDPDLDMDFEKFKFKAQLYWCNVRGKRYQVHQTAYLEEMLLPHTGVIQELFGISGEQLIVEIQKIWHALSFGVRDLSADLKLFKQDTIDAVAKKVNAFSANSKKSFSDIMAAVLKENAKEGRRDDIFGRLLGMELFDVQKLTNLPERLLDELSWLPGEEKDFFADGEFRGWPLRIWPVFKRPFIRLEGRHYCFDSYSLFDNIYRVIQRIVLRLKPDYKELWNKIQQSQSEGLPFKHFKHLLPGAKVLKQTFYRGKTHTGQTTWCEADGLLIYDDHLFVVEARAGAFTYTAPSSDFPAYIESLKNLVLKPAMQGRRFLDYLKSAESVPLFDSDHNEIGRIFKSDFRHMTVCAVTVDPFTEFAAQVQHLRKIGVDVGVEPVWAISIDDLRIYADIFENPLIFLHFVEQRMQAFRSDIIQCDDELDHLGLYLKHNHYSTYAGELQRDSDAQINFTGYRSKIDKFFHARLLDSNTPCPLKQEVPARVLEIVELLSRSNKPGKAPVAAYLLDISGIWRTKIHTMINDELRCQQTTKRPKPFSTHGNVKLTIFCWTEHSGPRDASLSLDHTQTLLVMNRETRRLVIELSYSSTYKLEEVNWTWVELASIPSRILPNLRMQAEALRQKRISLHRSKRRGIGRNESCPCGSGRKYKKCCLG